MNHRSSLSGRFGRLFLAFLVSQSVCRCLQAEDLVVYRCDVNGVMEFRQTACERGEETLTHVIDSSRGMTPAEPGLRLKKASEKTDTVVRTKVQPDVEERCWRKRSQLERVERRLRAGYKPSQYQRLHERQDAYETYIRRFCR